MATSKRRIAFDVETHLIRVGMIFPRLVCVTFAEYLGPGNVPHEILGRKDGCRRVVDYLRDPNVVLCGYNTSYDLGVIIAEAIDWARTSPLTAPATEDEIIYLVFSAYEQERVVDEMIRIQLIDIARGDYQKKAKGTYTLQTQALRWCGIKLAKEDTWRLHYAFWTDKPIEIWVQDAIDYALGDAIATANMDAAITAWIIKEGNPAGEMPDEWRQTRAAWVLHLMAGWGVRIDSSMVALIKENLLEQRKASYEIMDSWGIFKKDRLGNYKLTKKGERQKDMTRLKALIAEGFEAQGEPVPMTEKGSIKTDQETAEDSGHPAAMAYASISQCQKLLTTYIPILERGANGAPVTSSPNVLVASGRTSWRDPNWQNPPKVGGVRECVVAREGFVLCGADLDTVELRALAQSCLEIVGWSEMAAALQRGEDLHLSLAAEILGMDYLTAKAAYDAGDPIVSDARQTAKAPNFGFPGGMGAPKFAITQANADQPLCVDENGKHDLHASIARAKELREAWFKRWPEMRLYLQNAGEIVGDFGPSMVEQPWSGRLRGGLDYCSCANTYFQGRVADGTKLALWRLAWACYVDKTSPLYGSRLVLFLHDEVIMEVPEDRAHECAQELVRILVGAVQEVIPDIPITSAAVLTRRWYKGAKPVKVNNRLVPCKPEKDSKGKTKWVPDLLN